VVGRTFSKTIDAYLLADARSDLTKNSRTIGRLIWIHVPNTVSKSFAEMSEQEREQEAEQALKEKRIALGLVEGYVNFLFRIPKMTDMLGLGEGLLLR
jgi:hypothetical protein